MVLPRASVASAALAIAAVVAIGHLTAFVSTPPGSGPQSRRLRIGEAGSLPPAARRAAAARAAGVLGVEPLVACAAVGIVAGAALAAVRTSRAARPNRVLTQHPDRRLVSLWAFEGELGVQAPVGFWDPLGLSKDGDAAAFTRRRVTEIKHGRVSMFACLGYIVPEYVKWPGYCAPSERLAFADIPNGLGALSKVPGGGWLQIALFCGVVEKGLFVYDPSRAPGDYENAGVLGVPNGSTLPAGETKTRKLNAEIANGRLAMMAIIGMLFQDGLTGSAWGDWAMYTDSPLRATEDSGTGDVPDATEDSGTGDVPDGATEDSGTRDVPDGAAHAAGAVAFNPASQIGAMAPLGFWDPLGFCKDKDENNFLKLRGIELKHGRVAMLSIFGFWAEHAWRVPGFRDVPSGVYALTTFPGSVGFAFAVLLVGILELGPLPDLEKGNPPGNFGDPARLIDEEDWPIGTYDDQWRNFEINHCRLAMFGAIGAIAASLNTGKDAVEQWQTAKPAVIEFIKTTIWWAP